MKAKMVLWREGEDTFEKIFDWNDTVKTNKGDMLVKEISVYSEKLIIDKKEYFILEMVSANAFHNTLTANPYNRYFNSEQYL